MPPRFALLLLLVGTLPGCFLNRGGTGASDSGTSRVDAGTDTDAGEVDSGRRSVDAGACAEGTVDLDLNPANGCECVVTEQACEGLDDDCDGSIDEGCDCVRGGNENCGVNVGACEYGTRTCLASGTWGACEGAVGPVAEECNGVDDDCDGSIDTQTELCGTDVGLCTEGSTTCTSGVWSSCTGVAAVQEACEVGTDDEDCDGSVNEGCECLGIERQTCTLGSCEGRETCRSGSWGSCIVPSLGAETCNGLDDNCSGLIDDGTGDCAIPTGCDPVTNAFGTYLFCHLGRFGYTAARDDCAAFGYHLVTVDDDAENSMLTSEADSRRSGEWWIGIADTDGDGDFRWEGPPSGYENWNGASMSSGECGLIASADGDWDAKGCGGAKAYICEAPAP